MPTAIVITILIAGSVLAVSYVVITSSDSTPPAAVTDLAARNLVGSMVELHWTASGDDGDRGTAVQYDIRYASALIDTDAKFAAATQCIGEPIPADPGSVQTFRVTNLTHDTTYYFALKTADEVPNWSPLSNSPSMSIDIIPPATVTDLAPWYAINSSVKLRWTAPGDDGNNGTAAQYDIRYSSSVIDTDAKFVVATQCIGEPIPAAPGSVQKFDVTVLMNNTVYYFALKTADEVPNWSPLSNSTGIPPDFTLNDTNGSPWNLYSHIGNGKPMLLEFMHPDCSACKNVMSTLASIYYDYSPGLEMASVAITLEVAGFRNPPNTSMVNDFRAFYGGVWTYLVETSGTQVRDAYGVVSVPRYFLIGKDGGIAYTHVGTGSMGNLINKIENELLP